MKIISGSLFIILILASVSGCTGKSSGKKGSNIENDTVTVADTGYTGIKMYKSGGYMIKEVTFKNGVRNGLMRSFYKGGQQYQTFWYENGLREDSAIWYYPEGHIFRTTPYVHDTVDGIQRQYYRNGRLKAKIGYTKGLRNPLLEEFTQDGRLVRGYPEIVVTINDEYKTRGTYRIGLALSNKSKAKFYRGEFTDNRYDTARCKIINIAEGNASVNLRKTSTSTEGYVGVIAEIITDYGNKYLTYKKIELPYNDLK